MAGLRSLVFPLLALNSAWALFLAGFACWFAYGVELCAVKVQANTMVSQEERGAKLSLPV
jgi:hypothetical protein